MYSDALIIGTNFRISVYSKLVLMVKVIDFAYFIVVWLKDTSEIYKRNSNRRGASHKDARVSFAAWPTGRSTVYT